MIRDYTNAARLFKLLVMKNYNSILNTQILSALYIIESKSSDVEVKRNAEIGYELLKEIADNKYIIPKSANMLDTAECFKWNRDESAEELLGRQMLEKQKTAERDWNIKNKARPFYQQKIKIVYNSGNEELAETFLRIISSMQSKLNDSSLPAPSKIELKEYKERQEEFEEEGFLVILIGDSSYAKKVYRKAGSNLWTYGKDKNNIGIRIYSEGKKNVILARAIKNKHIDDLLVEAKKWISTNDVQIPDGVESVKFSFLKDLYKDKWKNVSGVDRAATVTTTIIGYPLIVAGQLLECISNGGQEIGNLTSTAKIVTLQYSLAFFQYLEMNEALIL